MLGWVLELGMGLGLRWVGDEIGVEIKVGFEVGIVVEIGIRIRDWGWGWYCG